MPKLPRSTSSATSSMASGTIPSRPAKPHPDRLKIMHLFPDRPLAYEVLLEHGRPMTRNELVGAIEARGFPLAGKNKSKNLGTILWRFRNRFDNIEGRGYWPKDVPLKG